MIIMSFFIVFIDGDQGMIGLQIYVCLCDCIDVWLFMFFVVECKDFVCCVDVFNVCDIVILCLFDVVVCEVVGFIWNLVVCVIDVSLVYCMQFEWVYGFFEMVDGYVYDIVYVKCVINFGCYLMGVIGLFCLLLQVGLLLCDYLVSIYVVFGYLGGGWVVVDVFELVDVVMCVLLLQVYGFVFEYKYVFEIWQYVGFVYCLFFVLVYGVYW